MSIDLHLTTTQTHEQETNVKGTFLTTQSFIRNFGGEGTIINLVSIGAALAVPGISSYASSKLAVIKITQAVALGTIPFPFSTA